MNEASGRENLESLSSQKSQSTNDSTKEAPQQKPSGTVIPNSQLKQLEEQHFIVKGKQKELGKPTLYCRVCNATLENIGEDKLKQHISGRSHKKNVRVSFAIVTVTALVSGHLQEAEKVSITGAGHIQDCGVVWEFKQAFIKIKGSLVTMKRIPSPSSTQTIALEAMLDSVAKQHALDPDSDLPVRLQVAEEMLEVLQSKIPDTKLNLYGSSLTCFGFKSSDVNLDLSIPSEDKTKIPQMLISIKELLLTNDKCSDVKDEFDLTIPQISFTHKKTGLTCHLCSGCELACKTSKLLNCYAGMNPVVCKLVWGLRFWAQSCSIDNKTDGGLIPYCLALMVIQFLQTTTPPILPKLNPEKETWNQNYKSKNTDSLGLLWFKLFRFYCIEFPIDESIISIRVKQPYSREERRWGRRRFAIEDPYITNHNVSTVNSDRVFEYIMDCMNASFIYFGTIPKPVALTSKAVKPTTTPPKQSAAVVKQSTSNENDGVEMFEEQCSESDNDDKPQKQRDNTRQSNQHDEDEIFKMEDLEDGSSSDQSKDSKQNLKIIENTIKDLHIFSTSFKLASSQSLPSNDSESEILYQFQQNILSGGRKPEVQCQCCKKDGHVSAHCPDLRKPVLKPLPALSAGNLEILSRVCAQVRAETAFSPYEIKFRESVLWNLEDYIQEVFPDSRLHLFGSSMNGFGFRDSDLDICMTLDGKNKEDVDCISIIGDLAKKLKQHRDCSNVVAITTAKVPIVKFYLRSVRREADISLYNVLALENTKMLVTYARLDDRVSILGYTLKIFAKLCDIGDASKGSLSSYAYILMLLHYLQKRNPPVIPVLQELYRGDTKPSTIIDHWNCWFFADMTNLHKVWKGQNTESVGSLWIGFLRYYTETFDWEHNVLCCRRTKNLTKFEKMWTRHVFAIEDPFNLDHNLGAGISRKMGNFIKVAMTRGRQRFGFPLPMPLTISVAQYYFNVDFLTDGMEAPSDRTCRVCGHIGHIARECPRLKRNRRDERFDNGQRSKFSNRPFATPNTTPRKRAATVPVHSSRKDSSLDGREDLRVGSLPNKSTLTEDITDTMKSLMSTPQESPPKTVPLQEGPLKAMSAPILKESHPNTETGQVGKESSHPVITTHTSCNRTQDQPLPPGYGTPQATITQHPFGLTHAPNQLITPEQFVVTPRPMYIQATRSPMQPVSSPGAQYPLVHTQAIHTPPRINPDGSRWDPWGAAASLPNDVRHYQQSVNKPSDQPRTRSVSESMVSSGSPPVMIPIGSPPHVFRSPPHVFRRDVPLAFVAPAVNVPVGYPHHTGSPIMHPSSFPSYIQMSGRNVEHQQGHIQSPAQPQPNMPTKHDNHMTADEFFRMVRHAEHKGINSSAKDQDFISRTIRTSSDVLLSHPVIKPILNSPKTEDEHKLFSKMEKVRSLWSSGETHLAAKNLEALPVPTAVPKMEPYDSKDGESAGRSQVVGLTVSSHDNMSENIDREMERSQANPVKDAYPHYSNEKETTVVQPSPSSSHENNGTKLPTGKDILREKPKDAVTEVDNSLLFDLKSFQKAFPVGFDDSDTNDPSPAQNHNNKHNERKQESHQDPKDDKKSNEKNKEDTSRPKRKVSKGVEAPPKRQKSKHVKNDDQVDEKPVKGNGESKGNRKASQDSSPTNVTVTTPPSDKGGNPPSGKGGSVPQKAKGGRNTPTKGKDSGGRSSAQGNGSTPSRGKGGGGPPSRGKGKGAAPSSAKSSGGAASSGNKGSGGGAVASPKGIDSASTSSSGSGSTPSSRKGSGGSATSDKGSGGAAATPKGGVRAVVNPKGSTSAPPSGKGGGGNTSQSKKGDRQTSQKTTKAELFPMNNAELRCQGSSTTEAKIQDGGEPSKAPSVVNGDGTKEQDERANTHPTQRNEDSKEGKRRRNRNRGRGKGKGRGNNQDQS